MNGKWLLLGLEMLAVAGLLVGTSHDATLWHSAQHRAELATIREIADTIAIERPTRGRVAAVTDFEFLSWDWRLLQTGLVPQSLLHVNLNIGRIGDAGVEPYSPHAVIDLLGVRVAFAGEADFLACLQRVRADYLLVVGHHDRLPIAGLLPGWWYLFRVTPTGLSEIAQWPDPRPIGWQQRQVREFSRVVWELSPERALTDLTPIHQVAFAAPQAPEDGLVRVVASGGDPHFHLPEMPGESRATGDELAVILEVTMPARSAIQVFYLTADSPHYEAAHHLAVRVAAGRQTVVVPLPTGARIGKLRIDPGQAPGECRIHRLQIAARPMPATPADSGADARHTENPQ